MKYQKLKGFRDFLPKEARKRAWLKAQMVKVFESWGYEPMETPTIEPFELFEGQIGEEENLFFKFKDLGGRNVALRYDQTVPTCRVIGEYPGQIIYPFRRYQIQPAFRAEKPQKGRYREFTQSDIDIFGVASPLADAEIIAVTLDLYKTLGFKKAVAIISSRDLLKDIPYPALSSIDKLTKIGPEGVISNMIEKGIPATKAREYLNYVKALKPNSDIKAIFNYLEGAGFPKDWYRFEPTLARSFSYSQGPIWEIIIPEYAAGSVGGGERYDAMIERVSGQKIPGTGIGIGFDRTLEALEACGLSPKFGSTSKVLVTVFSTDLLIQSIKVAALLRGADINTEVYPDPDVTLNKQLKYADKKAIPLVIIVGEGETKNNTVIVKNMKSGEQKTISTKDIVSFVSAQ